VLTYLNTQPRPFVLQEVFRISLVLEFGWILAGKLPEAKMFRVTYSLEIVYSKNINPPRTWYVLGDRLPETTKSQRETHLKLSLSLSLTRILILILILTRIPNHLCHWISTKTSLLRVYSSPRTWLFQGRNPFEILKVSARKPPKNLASLGSYWA